MKAQHLTSHPTRFNDTEDEFDSFDSEDQTYEYAQEAAESVLRLDTCNRTPARFDNDSWS